MITVKQELGRPPSPLVEGFLLLQRGCSSIPLAESILESRALLSEKRTIDGIAEAKPQIL